MLPGCIRLLLLLHAVAHVQGFRLRPRYHHHRPSDFIEHGSTAKLKLPEDRISRPTTLGNPLSKLLVSGRYFHRQKISQFLKSFPRFHETLNQSHYNIANTLNPVIHQNFSHSISSTDNNGYAFYVRVTPVDMIFQRFFLNNLYSIYNKCSYLSNIPEKWYETFIVPCIQLQLPLPTNLRISIMNHMATKENFNLYLENMGFRTRDSDWPSTEAVRQCVLHSVISPSISQAIMVANILKRNTVLMFPTDSQNWRPGLAHLPADIDKSIVRALLGSVDNDLCIRNYHWTDKVQVPIFGSGISIPWNIEEQAVQSNDSVTTGEETSATEAVRNGANDEKIVSNKNCKILQETKLQTSDTPLTFTTKYNHEIPVETTPTYLSEIQNKTVTAYHNDIPEGTTTAYHNEIQGETSIAYHDEIQHKMTAYRNEIPKEITTIYFNDIQDKTATTYHNDKSTTAYNNEIADETTTIYNEISHKITTTYENEFPDKTTASYQNKIPAITATTVRNPLRTNTDGLDERKAAPLFTSTNTLLKTTTNEMNDTTIMPENVTVRNILQSAYGLDGRTTNGIFVSTANLMVTTAHGLGDRTMKPMFTASKNILKTTSDELSGGTPKPEHVAVENLLLNSPDGLNDSTTEAEFTTAKNLLETAANNLVSSSADTEFRKHGNLLHILNHDLTGHGEGTQISGIKNKLKITTIKSTGVHHETTSNSMEETDTMSNDQVTETKLETSRDLLQSTTESLSNNTEETQYELDRNVLQISPSILTDGTNVTQLESPKESLQSSNDCSVDSTNYYDISRKLLTPDSDSFNKNIGTGFEISNKSMETIIRLPEALKKTQAPQTMNLTKTTYILTDNTIQIENQTANYISTISTVTSRDDPRIVQFKHTGDLFETSSHIFLNDEKQNKMETAENSSEKNKGLDGDDSILTESETSQNPSQTSIHVYSNNIEGETVNVSNQSSINKSIDIEFQLSRHSLLETTEKISTETDFSVDYIDTSTIGGLEYREEFDRNSVETSTAAEHASAHSNIPGHLVELTKNVDSSSSVFNIINGSWKPTQNSTITISSGIKSTNATSIYINNNILLNQTNTDYTANTSHPKYGNSSRYSYSTGSMQNISMYNTQDILSTSELNEDMEMTTRFTNRISSVATTKSVLASITDRPATQNNNLASQNSITIHPDDFSDQLVLVSTTSSSAEAKDATGNEDISEKNFEDESVENFNRSKEAAHGKGNLHSKVENESHIDADKETNISPQTTEHTQSLQNSTFGEIFEISKDKINSTFFPEELLMTQVLYELVLSKHDAAQADDNKRTSNGTTITSALTQNGVSTYPANRTSIHANETIKVLQLIRGIMHEPTLNNVTDEEINNLRETVEYIWSTLGNETETKLLRALQQFIKG